ncbi:metallophosphoesterase [Hydrogenovibrio sp. SC-1]|uniref:metallophosphoesterase n=1 Tax=Hydrogenovibrio sp. SC-1 TaxID=2065820 RepID=UPI001E48AB32|nr:metallophosphoesterase [Hydrogenovibrio sp. SC-1]
MIYAQSVEPWQAQATSPIQVPLENWLAPTKDTYFFTDLHADAEAFLRSLKLSHLVTLDSTVSAIQLTTKAMSGQIIIGGDCFDKGPSNLQLLKLIAQLRSTDLVILAGNHDIRLYAGLRAIDFMEDACQAHFFVRMGRKVINLFAEVYRAYCQDLPEVTLTDAEIRAKLFPNKDWFNDFPVHAKPFLSAKKINKECQQIARKKHDFTQAWSELGFNLKQLYQAAEQTRRLFVQPEGEFAWFFSSLNLLHISGSYCFSHAGMDDQIAEKLSHQSVDELNDQLHQHLQAGHIFQLYYSAYGNVFRTKYRENDWPLTEQGAAHLKQQHLFALVNGHRSHLQGQQLFIRQGLLHFECDTLLNANCRLKSNRQSLGEAVTIFYADGMVSALSGDYPATKQFHPKDLDR